MAPADCHARSRPGRARVRAHGPGGMRRRLPDQRAGPLPLVGRAAAAAAGAVARRQRGRLPAPARHRPDAARKRHAPDAVLLFHRAGFGTARCPHGLANFSGLRAAPRPYRLPRRSGQRRRRRVAADAGASVRRDRGGPGDARPRRGRGGGCRATLWGTYALELDLARATACGAPATYRNVSAVVDSKRAGLAHRRKRLTCIESSMEMRYGLVSDSKVPGRRSGSVI